MRWWEGNLTKAVDVRSPSAARGISHPCPPKNTPAEKVDVRYACLVDRTGLWLLSESLTSEMLPGLVPRALRSRLRCDRRQRLAAAKGRNTRNIFVNGE